MKIDWAPRALFDLADLQDYIAGDSPEAAVRVVAIVADSVQRTLGENHELGRAGRVPGTRELVIPKITVIVPYRIRGNTLEILRVYHQARAWPDHF